jgi:predicted  nucleic acid-binding Zn-ribbon protein
MSEDKTKDFSEHATNPLPFEEFVRAQFEMLNNRISGLQAEMVERFLQVSRHVREVSDQVRALDERVGRLEEQGLDTKRRLRRLDDKVGIFVEEHHELKRDVQELQESSSPKN